MHRNEAVYYALLLILIVAGYLIGRFAGGIITGVGLSMLIAIFTGKAAARRSTDRINKNVRDILINEKNNGK